MKFSRILPAINRILMGKSQSKKRRWKQRQHIFTYSRDQLKLISLDLDWRVGRTMADIVLHNLSKRARLKAKITILTIKSSRSDYVIQQKNMGSKKPQKIGTKSIKKGIYNKYSYETRKKLIVLVQEEKLTLASAAKELGICQTTGRLILSTYKDEGRVFEKKSDKEKRMRREAKKRAHEKRKERSIRQREERDEEIAENEVVNAISSLKIEEESENNGNQSVQNALPVAEIAEVAEPQLSQTLPYPIWYQFYENGVFYYFQTTVYLPHYPNMP